MRLIDAHNLGVGRANPDAFKNREYANGWNNAIKAITEAAPAIDPETLPIVQQLRAELERVTAERDKIAQYELDACGEYCFGDSSTGIPECEWLDSNGRCKLKEWVKENTAGKGDGLNESAQETAGERLP